MAEGDAALLGQVFEDLLSNALKLSSGRERPVIEVGSRDDEGRVGEGAEFSLSL